MPQIPLFPPQFPPLPGTDPFGSIPEPRTAGDIDKFVNFFQGGVLSPSKYSCEIIYPNILNNKAVKFQLAESITLPGRSLATLQRRTFGTARDVPYERIFPGEIEVSFIMTPSTVGLHRIEFSDWMDAIVSPQTNFVNVNRADYTGLMYITLEDAFQESVHSVEFVEVFPKAIQPISLSYGAENDYIRQTVSFSFKRYIESDSGTYNWGSRIGGTSQL